MFLNSSFFILLTFLVIGSLAQLYYPPARSECEKFCFEDCEDYRSPWIWGLWGPTEDSTEYTRCISANRYCRCESQGSLRTEGILLLSISIGLAAVAVILYFYKKCRAYQKERNWNRDSASSQPITPSASNVEAGVTNYDTFASPTAAPVPSLYNGYQVPSRKQSDLPPEYMPPPSYYDSIHSSPNPEETDINSTTQNVVRRSSLIKD